MGTINQGSLLGTLNQGRSTTPVFTPPKLTAVQIHNAVASGQITNPQQLDDIYAQNDIPFPARVPIDQLQPSSQPAPTGTIAPAAPAGPSAAQTDPLLSALASLDTILANKNTQTNQEYQRAIDSYNSQDAIDAANHDQNVHQNEQNLTANNQAALLNAANGATGLRAVLASLGGLAGSGVDVIRRLVGLAANADTGAARQTFDTNATNVNQAWSQAEEQARQRRADALATRDNNLQNNKAGVLSSRQAIYEQLANLFGAGTDQGNNYASEASALAAPIAATTRATVAPYAKASSLFTPAALQDYLAGTQNLNVNTSGGGGASTTPINSPIYSSNRKKDQLAGVA